MKLRLFFLRKPTDLPDGPDSCCDTISLDEDDPLFAVIREIKATPVSFDFSLTVGEHQMYSDDFGKRIHYVSAQEIKSLRSENPWNKAVLAFIQNIPDDTIVVLYWQSY